MHWTADKPHFTVWDVHIMGHHLKSQYIDHMKEKALEKKKLGEKMFCTHEHK